MAYCLTVEAIDGSIVLYGALGTAEAYSIGRSAIDSGGEIVDVSCSKPDGETLSPNDHPRVAAALPLA